MTAQREFFSRGKELKAARSTWRNSILEKTIVKSLMQGLIACRIPVFRINAPIPCSRCHRYSCEPNEAGIPDIVGFIPKRMVDTGDNPFGLLSPVPATPLFIEVKRPKGGVESEAQKAFIERARKDGAIAFFARGWDECADNLRQAGVKIPEGL